MAMEIQHFMHDHPLVLRVENKNDDQDEDECFLCEQPILGAPRYCCSQCEDEEDDEEYFIIHKSCAELQQHIQHPFHKLHPLTLVDETPTFFNPKRCRACETECSGFLYQCKECNFKLCIRCIFLEPTTSYEGHPHLLTLFEETSIHRCKCCIFGMASNSSWFRCVECDFSLHKSCFELPQQIQHPFHPLHALALTRDKSGACHCTACQDWCYGFVYSCEACNFNIHRECALLVPTVEYEGHDHLLTFFNNIYGKNQTCNSCDSYCLVNIFRCVECDFNIHEICNEFPNQIQHPFHPIHPLTLVNHFESYSHPTKKNWRCNACKVWMGYKEVFYRCEECDFNIDIECASLLPTINFKGHEHLLTILKINIEEDKEGPSCYFCDKPCHAMIFSCVKCDFNWHIYCIPSLLPGSIKHECHIDPLTLTDEVTEEGYSYDEYYCDACETKRNAYTPLYYCKECQFEAHIECVMSEVLPLILAEQESKMKEKEMEIKPDSVRLDEEIQRYRMDVEPQTKKLEKLRNELEGQRKVLETQSKKMEAGERKIEAQEEKLEAVKAKLEALQAKRSQLIDESVLR